MTRPTSAQRLPKSLDLFTGHISPAEARVYLRDSGSETLATSQSPSGEIQGPFCSRAHTLVARYRFVCVEGKSPSGDGVLQASTVARASANHFATLAEAVVPDPCFWSPDTPHQYVAHVHATLEPSDAAEIRFGIRPLGVNGNLLRWESRRWVPRIIRAAAVPPSPSEHWRALGAAQLVVEPEAAQSDDASHEGGLLVAELRDESAAPLELLRTWSLAPAVVLVAASQCFWSRYMSELPMWRRRVPNLLWGAWATSDEAACSTLPIDVWMVVDAETCAPHETTAPWIACAARHDYASLDAARIACDSLQAHLAARGGTWAGFLV